MDSFGAVVFVVHSVQTSDDRTFVSTSGGVQVLADVVLLLAKRFKWNVVSIVRDERDASSCREVSEKVTLAFKLARPIVLVARYLNIDEFHMTGTTGSMRGKGGVNFKLIAKILARNSRSKLRSKSSPLGFLVRDQK